MEDDRFRVMSAAEFIERGPPLGSRAMRDALERERREIDARSAERHRRAQESAARRSAMTAYSRLEDDLAMLREMQAAGIEAAERVEAAFRALESEDDAWLH